MLSTHQLTVLAIVVNAFAMATLAYVAWSLGLF
jgi:hypothetical protein